MFCTQCGADNPDHETTCKSCGAELTNPYRASAAGGFIPGQKVPNYLVQSILVTLCCCLPFGIPAIVYASQVDSKLAGGDYQGAVASSNSAKMWCWIGFGLGLTVQVVYFGLIILGAVTGNLK